MNSTYRVTFHSINNLQNRWLIIVNYLILPLISLIFFLLIAFNSNQNYTRVLLGTIIISAISTNIGIITSSVVYDQNVGVFDEIISLKPTFKQYWLPKFVISNLVMLVELLILSSIGLFTLHYLNLLPHLLLAALLIVIIASSFSYLAAISGLKHENPYWLANLIIGSLVLVSGTIIPTSQYPFWLRVISILFPMSDLLDWITTPSFFNSSILGVIIKEIFWLIFIVIITIMVNRRLRN